MAIPFYRAWAELHEERGFSDMGSPHPLQRVAITDWLNESGIRDPVERQAFREVLRSLDVRWRVLQSRHQRREANKHTNKSVPIEVDEEDED